MNKYNVTEERYKIKLENMFEDSDFLYRLSMELVDTEYRIKNIYTEKLKNVLEKKVVEYRELLEEEEKKKLLEQMKGILLALKEFESYNFEVDKKITNYTFNDIENYIEDNEQPF